MSAHDTSLQPVFRWATSAEPSGLGICREVVFANAVAGDLADMPLLTPVQASWAMGLLRLLQGGEVDPARIYSRFLLIGVIATMNREARRALFRDASAHTPKEVISAARDVETVVQDRLWLLGGPGVVVDDRTLTAELWEAQSQAHRAVVAVTGSRKAAKETQRSAAGDRTPLTVCRGRKYRQVPEIELRRRAAAYLQKYPDGWLVNSLGDGCGMIILDTPESRHPKTYCEHCAKRAGKTMNAGLTKHAFARLRAAGCTAEVPHSCSSRRAS
jgi:hypothetical protein